jgi:hypothetical protein
MAKKDCRRRWLSNTESKIHLKLRINLSNFIGTMGAGVEKQVDADKVMDKVYRTT